MKKALGYTFTGIAVFILIFCLCYLFIPQVKNQVNGWVSPGTQIEQPGGDIINPDIDIDWLEAYNALSEKHKQLILDYNNAINELDTTKTNLADTQDKLNKTQSALDDEKELTSSQQDTITQLETDVLNYKNQVSSLETTITQLESKIAELEAKLAEYEGQVGTTINTTPIEYFVVDGYGGITGLTEEGQELTEIVIPISYSLGTPILTEELNKSYDSCVSMVNAFYINPLSTKYPFYIKQTTETEYTVLTSDSEVYNYAFTASQSAMYDIKYYKKTLIDGYREIIRSIEMDAFKGNTNLKKVTILDNITYVGRDAFSTCRSLEEVILPNSLTAISDNAFNYCTRLKSIVIPDSVTSIGTSAFEGCSSLTNITIPESVISIGEYAFRNSYNIVEFDFTDYTFIPTLGIGAFDGLDIDCKIYVPDDLYNDWIVSTNWSEYLHRIYTPSGVGGGDVPTAPLE